MHPEEQPNPGGAAAVGSVDTYHVDPLVAGGVLAECGGVDGVAVYECVTDPGGATYRFLVGPFLDGRLGEDGEHGVSGRADE
ncbi:hypothetical protein [Plantactinospora sp. B24E8]|uniref:hypothetical protein n=1 Tax=Plantactinospora sp. B24E8 TaxID=3153567 RepID=UPI00325F3208